MVGTEYTDVAPVDVLKTRFIVGGLVRRVVRLFEHFRLLFRKGVARGYFAGTTSYMPSVRT
jgi:hypothetical protein